MRKTKSFSTYGAFLERKSQQRIDPEAYERAINRAKQNPMEVLKKDALFIQGFDRVTSREKPSSYQLYNIKDYNNQSNYNPKNEFLQTRNAHYPVRRESERRLKDLIVEKEKYEQLPLDKTCSRFQDVKRDEKILTSRDLQNKRKSYHSMDFKKQSQRPNSYVGIHEGRETITDGFQSHAQTTLLKSKSVHSFTSYPKRQFLSQKKLTVKRAPPSSGIDGFKIPQQKFKNSWKVVSPPKFQKVSKKHLNRFDAIESPWHTKLSYNAKQELVKNKVPILKMSLQTERKVNQVHSKYPIRLAS